MSGPGRTNLRVPASSFVGREDDLAALNALFEGARLVTLLGPGGMGKTRLSLRFAQERVGTWGRRGGVWIVELSAARGTTEFLVATAAVLNVELGGLSTDLAMADAIGRALAARGPTLLVLDNFEHLRDGATHVDRWIAMAPSARILVTSRVVLGLTAEAVHVLPPLRTEDATQLFLGRAARAGLRGEPTASDRNMATEIVEAIDRMPLAIELAASRTRVLSMGDLRKRLERPLHVLGGGRDRHASMREVVLDSVAALSPRERRLFALASALRGPFTLTVAEWMLEDPAVGGELAVPGAVLDGLDALVRSSLLRAFVEPDLRSLRGSPREHAGFDQPARYAYFETLRDVAEELRAEDPASEALAAAHARALSRLAASHLRSSHAEATRIDPRDHDDLITAHATSVRLAVERQDADRAKDAAILAHALEPSLSVRGLSRLREDLFSGVLRAMDATKASDREARTEALLQRGLARRELGEATGARDDFEAGLRLARAASASGLAAVALTRLGGIHDLAGDTARARVHLEEALTLLSATQDDATRTRREAEAHLRVGHALRREGALDAAREAIERAVLRHRALDDDPGLAAALYELAVIEMFAGRVPQAFACFDEGLVVARRSGARVMEGAHTTARGCLLQDTGQLDLALAHHAEAARIFREVGSRYREASALYYLATTYHELREHLEALEVLRQARARSADVGAPRYEALIAGGLALTLAALGRHDEARAELEIAEQALARVPNEPSLTATLACHRVTLALRAGQVVSPEVLARQEAQILAAPSDDTRFALRAQRQAQDQVGSAVAAPEALLVWGAGEAFRRSGSARVDLPARSPLRRILDRLVQARLEAPGEVLSIDDLIAAGWPDERIGADAALNRAYVALANLRKRGLRDVIVSSAGGYALSQSVVVRRAEE